MEVLEKLQKWYLSNCDGDWEHSYGVKIDTLDNPGWGIDIDIVETKLEEKPFEKIIVKRSQDDWIHCDVEEGSFKGRGGPSNLKEILEVFCNWVEKD